jgi:hypothetical protein
MTVRISHSHGDAQLAGKLLLVTEETSITYSGWLQPSGIWVTVQKSDCVEPFAGHTGGSARHLQETR